MSKVGRAKKAPTNSEQELHLLVEAIPALVWRAGPEGDIEYVNQRVLQYLGAPLAEIIGWGWMEKVHPDDVAFKAKTWLTNLESGNSHDAACRFRGADGQYRWFEVRAEPLRASDSRVLSWYGVLIDIDDRRKAEEAIRESEYKLRQIIETVPSLLWSLGPNGEQTQLSQRALDYIGVRFEDLVHLGWTKFLHPDDLSETENAFSHAIRTGTSYQAVHRLRRYDGEYRWHHARGEPLRDRQGRVIQWYGLTVDIEERKQAEDRLRRNEAYLAEAQDLSHTGSFGWTPSTGELHWSDETFRILEYDQSIKPTIEGVLQRIHPDDRAKIRQLIVETSTGEKHFDVAHRLLMPDGSVKFVHVLSHALHDSAGNLEIVGALMDVTANTLLYRDLAEREAKIRRLIDSNIIGIFIWDFDGHILEANDAFLRMVNYDREDMVSGRMYWTELTPPDWRDRNNLRIKTHRSGGHFPPFEKEYTRKDGARVPVLMGGATFEEGGNQGVAFVLDLTEHRRAEEAAKRGAEALRRSEAYLSEAQSLSHTGSAAYNETAILYWSDENYRIFGFDPREGLPSRMSVQERIHPDDLERVSEEARQAVKQKRDYRLDYRIMLPDGTVKYVETNAHPKFSEGEGLVEVVSTIIDVTERKRAEQALRESEGKFRDYAESASDWFWEIGPDYKFTILTENAFGSNAADRIGAVCWDRALDFETEPEKWRLLWATLDSRQSFRDFVYCSMGGGGSPMYVKASGKPVFDGHGEFLGYRGAGADVTATIRAQEEHERLRQLESDLAHMNRLSVMGELTASLAHEITQPIASARNNARAALNFLDKHPADLDEVREAISSVLGDADRAGNIIDRIRDHISKAPPRKHRFDLNEAINEVLVLARSAIADNGVSVQTRLREGLAPVEGDRVQLQQVILNLILNATEAMSAVDEGARELLISTAQRRTDGVLATVSDSGPGIDAERRERVFEAFYTTKSSGTGMGLSICRSIIDAHGGRLWADANEPRGAVFQFTLPSPEMSS